MKTSFKIIMVCMLLAASFAAGYLLVLPKTAPDIAAEDYISSLCSPCDTGCSTDAGKLLENVWFDALSYELGTTQRHGMREAEISVDLRYADINSLTYDISGEFQTLLRAKVDAAKSLGDIYNDELEFLPEVLNLVYLDVLKNRTAKINNYVNSVQSKMKLKYSGKTWIIINKDEIDSILCYVNFDDIAQQALDTAAEDLEFIPKHFPLPLDNSAGPQPDVSLFKETYDAAVITSLLETAAAKHLIGTQQLCWNEDIPLLSNSPIRYYLDESILVLVWQQLEAETVGTFAEVFISDASQLRRKLSDDFFGSEHNNYGTELSRQANAVLALSGDFYNFSPYERVLGVYVYDGTVCRSNLRAGQTCYFDREGNMIFSYEGQFASTEEAQNFVNENGVRFSLSFGPVLIENGVDRLPDNYPIGEINDYYARYAIGQLGERHYLAMTMNCTKEHYYLATLRQACDAMLKRGCINGYTLDGGQTGSIILNHQLINPVQFGFERTMSDIFYFASAIG